MASRRFDKGIGEVRPGTYIDYIDTHDYVADGKESGVSVSGGSGNGSTWSLPDYYLGHEAEVVSETDGSDTVYISDYLVAKEDCYSGDELKEVS